MATLHTTVVKSFGGWRQTVEITQAGPEGCRELLRNQGSERLEFQPQEPFDTMRMMNERPKMPQHHSMKRSAWNRTQGVRF